MNKIIPLLQLSFNLLIKNLSIVYPFLFYLVLVDLIFPGTLVLNGASDNWVWLAWLTLFILMLSAFCSGWLNMFYNMTGQALLGDNFNNDSETSDTEKFKNGLKTIVDTETGKLKTVLNKSALEQERKNPLTLFKFFTIGVGDYFLPMALGWVIYFAIAAALLWWAHSNIIASGGYPDVLNEMTQLAAKGPEFQSELLNRLRAITPAEEQALSYLGNQYLISLAALTGITLVTIFWAPIVLIKKTNVIEAYAQSIKLFLSKPVPLVVLGLAYITGAIMVSLLGSVHIVVGLLAWFVWLYVDMTMVIFLFLWVFEHLQPAEKNNTIDVTA